jgi:IgGFc binding protein/Bacterial Ig domain/Immunoglobulin I-set domain/Regulator of chromosome condensation (RCC1) repeat
MKKTLVILVAALLGVAMQICWAPSITNGLWVQINGVSNDLAYLTIHGTTNGVQYEISSRAGLADETWNSEGLVWGDETTNWTATTVALNGRANLFFRAQSLSDAVDGSTGILTMDSLPSITTQPTNQTVMVGGNVTFSVGATGTGYQWRRNGSNLINGDRISGANTNVLILTGVRPQDAGIYTVVVSNAAGNVTSTYAVLRVWTPSAVIAWGDNTYGQTNVPSGLTNAVAVAGGWHHSLALKNGGTVVAWGDNASGQTNVPSGLANVVAVAGGYKHSLALKSDGTVVAWGDNIVGETNVPYDLTNAVSISAVGLHSLALKSDGTVVTWGYNQFGQANVPSGLTNVVAIAGGGMHSLVLKSDGTVVAWGNNDYGQTNVPSSLTNVVAIAGCYYHSLALKGDGTVVAWGCNDEGETNVPSSLTNAVAVAGGYQHSLALKGDGTVVAWGNNDYGQTNVPSGLTNVVAVAGGGLHSLALFSNNFSPPVINDSTGTNFWVLFFDINNRTFDPSLMISSSYATTGTVSIPGLNWNQPFSVTPDTVTTVDIPIDAFITDYDTVTNLGVHVTAGQPVSVYGLNYEPAASEAFLGYPTPMLGTNYCVMAYQGYPSQFAIVATTNDTTVIIKPSATADLVRYDDDWMPIEADDPSTNLLQQGETYQLSGDTDVTGTFITSDKPIAVFAGAADALVPEGIVAANPLVEEQLPVASWGRQALGFPLAGRKGDSYRVLAATSNTVVTVNGSVVATLTNAGDFYDMITDVPVEFRGSNPIQVAQFSNGAGFDNVPGGIGDPFEMLMLPTAYYMNMNAYTVSTPTNTSFVSNYLNLIVEQSAIPATSVDYKSVPAASFKPIGYSGYYGAQVAVTAGAHTVSSSKPVGVQVYGFGDTDGYGYIGGVANVKFAAIKDAFLVPLNTAVTNDVLANDIFSSRSTVALSIVSQPSHGNAVTNASKNVIYTPNPGYSGDDQYTYQITEQGNSATATVTVFQPPTAVVSGNATISASHSATIQAELTGKADWVLTWSDSVLMAADSSHPRPYFVNVITTNSSSPARRSVSPPHTTTYSVIAISDSRCRGTSSGSATITVTPCVETGPITMWDQASCSFPGSVKNPGALDYTSTNVRVGATITPPVLVTPVTFNGGGVIIPVWYNCEPSRTITWSFCPTAGPLYFEPSIPNKITKAATYHYTAKVNGTSEWSVCPTITNTVATVTIVVSN